MKPTSVGASNGCSIYLDPLLKNNKPLLGLYVSIQAELTLEQTAELRNKLSNRLGEQRRLAK